MEPDRAIDACRCGSFSTKHTHAPDCPATWGQKLDDAYLYESEADAMIARETDAVIEAARRIVAQPFNHIRHEDLIALREALDAYE